MIYLQWLLLLIPSILLELLGYVFNPIAALFVTKRERTDRVKRLHTTDQITMQREYLSKYVYWFQTHDNAVDEYWWDLYTEDSAFKYIREMTQEEYDNSWFNRYLMRVMWMYRNNAYGLLYNILSKPDRRGDSYNEFKHGEEDVTRFWFILRTYDNSGFQFEGHFPLLPMLFGINVYNDLNVGWKAHRSAVRCLYANRFIGIRVENNDNNI